MNIFSYYSAEITAIAEKLARDGKIPLDEIPPAYCEPPRDSSHGELSTNYALVMARPAKMPPKELAEILAKAIGELDGINSVSVAGAGFINMTLEPRMWQERITDILKMGEKWGNNNIGKGETINVEYVSANPTGPLHVAHARGGIVGDSLANLLEKSGYKVTREYYVNDAGKQVDVLARSVYMRYLQLLEYETAKVWKDEYPSDYVMKAAENLLDVRGRSILKRNAPEISAMFIKGIMRKAEKNLEQSITENFPKDLAPFFSAILREVEGELELSITKQLRDGISDEDLSEIRTFAVADIMQGIKEDLQRLNIRIDHFSSERELVEKGAVDEAIKILEKKDLIYDGKPEKPKSDKAEDWEPRKQVLFKSTKFGDDVDRTLKKSDNSLTYFATDIAYHLDKLERGSEVLINIWGADHGGYVKRLKAALEALTGRKDSLNVQLVQLVKLMDKGKPVKMSKRAGDFITLSEVLQNVDPNILRFIMLTRRSDQPLDFDYAKVKEQTRENPVFYVQYAYTRAYSVLSQKRGKDASNLTLLTDESEIQLIRHLASFPREVEAAAKNFEPHRIAFYLIELAGLFHALWNRLRFLGVEAELEDARLQLVEATAIVLQNGLGILGVSAPKEM